jgi:hypothetical protein
VRRGSCEMETAGRDGPECSAMDVRHTPAHVPTEKEKPLDTWTLPTTPQDAAALLESLNTPGVERWSVAGLTFRVGSVSFPETALMSEAYPIPWRGRVRQMRTIVNAAGLVQTRPESRPRRRTGARLRQRLRALDAELTRAITAHPPTRAFLARRLACYYAYRLTYPTSGNALPRFAVDDLRRALLELSAHSLPPAQRDVALELLASGWDTSPTDLAAVVRGITL